MAVVAALKSLVGNDDVATLEARSASCAAELTSAGASQVVHERELHDAERRGDVPAGDKAALRLEQAGKQIARLRVRRVVIAEALAEAKAVKAAEAKASRVDVLKAECERARLAADRAEKLSVSLCLKLAASLGVYANEGAAERTAASLLEREIGVAVSCARRSVGIITSAVLREAGSLSSFDISLPVMR